MGISKKTYYYSMDFCERIEKRYGRIKDWVKEIIEDNPAYGYRRIKKALFEKYDEIVNHKALLVILRAWGLELKRKIRPLRRSWIVKILDYLQLRANLVWFLSKSGLIKNCFQVIVSDTTELLYRGAKAYLCVHLDIFGKMIYGYKLSMKPDSQMLLHSFRNAVKTITGEFGIQISGMIFHQDRGSINTGSEYVSAVLGNEARLSYSRRGEPGDNAVNESFFSRFKDEWRDVFIEAKTFGELESMVKKAIEYYNSRRYHSTIGLEVPEVFTMKQSEHLINQSRVVS